MGESGEHAGAVAQCDPAFMSLSNNFYSTKTGNASLMCGRDEIPIVDLKRTNNVEHGSKVGVLPPKPQILSLMKRHLHHIFDSSFLYSEIALES
mmetsp:Transcript_11820/g.14709  ORF Transcript_11820/g.14709 Transcript_11820/m.14709 type:complete len:94 (-) Transcript_11820:1281-1562(-)